MRTQRTGLKSTAAALALALMAMPGIALASDSNGSRRGVERPSFGGYLAGRVARTNNDTEAAAVYFRKALAQDAQNDVLIEQTMQMDAVEGRIEDAVVLARRLIERHPTHRTAGLLLGVDAFKRGDIEKALAHLKSASVSLVGEVTSMLGRAWVLYANSDVDGALATLDGVRQADWAQFYLRYHKAMILDLADRSREAGVLYEQAFKGEQRLLRLTLAYARHAARRGDRKLARSILADHVKRSQGTPHPFIAALSAELADSSSEVQLLAETARDGLAEVFFGLGEALSSESAGIGPGTIYLQLALHLKPDFPLALAALASVHETTKRYESAIGVYSRIPAGTPLQDSISIRKALLLNQLDRLDESVDVLERMARSDPTDARALEALGNIMRSRKRFDRAVAYYDRVIGRIGKPAKQHWTLYFARGTAHERLKNWPKAEADLKKALELQPDQPSVLNYLGYSWVDQNKNLKLGMEYIKKAVRLKPDDGHIVDSLGWAYFRLGNYKEAVRYLERAVELMPQDPILNDHLGDAYWRVGRQNEARFQWSQSLTLKPEPEDAEKVKAKLAAGLPPSRQARAVRKAKQPSRREAARKKQTESQTAPFPQLQ